MPDIVVTEFMDAEPLADLEEKFTVLRDDSLWEHPDRLLELVKDCRGLIVRNKTQVTAALLDAAPGLEVIGRLGVGLDNIDMDACASRNVRVCPATGANANAVAEYVVTCALVLLRGAYSSTDSMVIDMDWPRSELGNGREAARRTLGLIGFGNIGQATAQRARALGMTVIAHDPVLPATDPAWADVQKVELKALLEAADVISLHIPLTENTRNLISADEISSMKPGAILINTARGGIVDEGALAEALRSRHLGGAALDVFANEPPADGDLIPFFGLGNVILTPHIAGLSADANVRVSRLTVDNVLRVLSV